MAFVVERTVLFQDVDAAGIVFFPRFFDYAHDAMAALFDEVPGGYVDIITRRKIGFPAVHVTADWKAPIRFGDRIRIEVTVPKIGTTSCTFRYRFTRPADDVHIATIEHVTVSSDLTTMAKLPLPPDCRAVLEAHVA